MCTSNSPFHLKIVPRVNGSQINCPCTLVGIQKIFVSNVSSLPIPGKKCPAICVQAAPFPVWLLAFVAWQCLGSEDVSRRPRFCTKLKQNPTGETPKNSTKIGHEICNHFLFWFLPCTMPYIVLKKNHDDIFGGLFQSFTSEPFHPKHQNPCRTPPAPPQSAEYLPGLRGSPQFSENAHEVIS